MSHPDLRRRIGGIESGAEQRPLHAPVTALRVRQVGGQIPPFDAERGMREVVARKLHDICGIGQGKSRSALAQAREPLREGRRRQQRRAGMGE